MAMLYTYCHLWVFISIFDTKKVVNLSRFNYFIIRPISTPLCVVYLYGIGGQESQGSNCSVQPIAICSTWQRMAHHDCWPCLQIQRWLVLPLLGLCDVICKYVKYGSYGLAVLSHPNIGWSPFGSRFYDAERCISHGNFVCLSVHHTLVYPDEWR